MQSLLLSLAIIVVISPETFTLIAGSPLSPADFDIREEYASDPVVIIPSNDEVAKKIVFKRDVTSSDTDDNDNLFLSTPSAIEKIRDDEKAKVGTAQDPAKTELGFRPAHASYARYHKYPWNYH